MHWFQPRIQASITELAGAIVAPADNSPRFGGGAGVAPSCGNCLGTQRFADFGQSHTNRSAAFFGWFVVVNSRSSTGRRVPVGIDDFFAARSSAPDFCPAVREAAADFF